MKPPLLLFLFATAAIAQTTRITLSAPEPDRSISVAEKYVPENPKPQKAGFWSVRGFEDPPLRTNREVLHDKTWLATQAFWAGAIVYDTELTHQGLAHHRCSETTVQLGPYPSRGAIYRNDLPEYIVGTAFNYAMLRLFTKPMIFEVPSWGSIRHIQGGSEWLLDCW